MSRSPSPMRSRSRSPSRSRSRSRAPEVSAEAEACPFLIRVFVTKGKHAPLIDFDEGRFPVSDEFQVHGWKHSTPTSLVQQLFSVFPPTYRSPAARYAFKHVYVDASDRGLYRARELVNFSGRDFVATVAPSSHSHSHENGAGAMDRDLDDVAPAPRMGVPVEERTLDSYGFMTGDLLSVAITVPEPRVAPGAGAGGANGAGGAPKSIRGAYNRERAERAGAGAGVGSGSAGRGDRDHGDRSDRGIPRDRARGDRDAPPHLGGRGDRWGRGAPLPPQGWSRDGPTRAPSGDWRAAAASDGAGRGGRRGSPERGVRRDRSRSPVRRESWGRRRD